MDYLTLKWIHILSSTILFGTGIGLAFYFFMAHQFKELSSIQFATRMVVKGDLWFTTPAGIVQLLSGTALIFELGLDFAAPWLIASLVLFVFAGLCWLPVVWIQIRMRDWANAASQLDRLPQNYWKYYQLWVALGSLAFPALVIVFWLMITKPDF